MIFQNATKPKEDNYVGSLPYIISDYTFQNIKGEATPCDLALESVGSTGSVNKSIQFKVFLNGIQQTPENAGLYVNGRYYTPEMYNPEYFIITFYESGDYTIQAKMKLDGDIISSNKILFKVI
jgi:hypothetical protein